MTDDPVRLRDEIAELKRFMPSQAMGGVSYDKKPIRKTRRPRY